MLIQSQNITTPKSQIENPSLNIHYELLDKYFEEWKGEFEQVDDIIVIGFKI